MPFLILGVEAFTILPHLSVPDGSGSLKIGKNLSVIDVFCS